MLVFGETWVCKRPRFGEMPISTRPKHVDALNLIHPKPEITHAQLSYVSLMADTEGLGFRAQVAKHWEAWHFSILKSCGTLVMNRSALLCVVPSGSCHLQVHIIGADWVPKWEYVGCIQVYTRK